MDCKRRMLDPMKWIQDKTILVTGGTGTIGSELVRQLLAHGPRQVRVFSRDDTKQYELLESLHEPENLRLLIGDIRDKERLEFALQDVDVVFHAAALKHVPICEYNPVEAIETNIIGSQNVIEASVHNRVKKVIAISTDKAANPTNIIGMTKLFMEKLFINANYTRGATKTLFSCVRFGNVTWSRGSVLPLWKEQIRESKCIKISNPVMTRFLMSQTQAIHLTMQAMEIAHGGEIFILKMPSIALGDLAELFLKKYYPNGNIQKENTGVRAGEKLHEELIDFASSHNYTSVYENDSMFVLIPNPNAFHIGSSFYKVKGSERGYPECRKATLPERYSSEDHIDIPQIEKVI